MRLRLHNLHRKISPANSKAHLIPLLRPSAPSLLRRKTKKRLQRSLPLACIYSPLLPCFRRENDTQHQRQRQRTKKHTARKPETTKPKTGDATGKVTISDGTTSLGGGKVRRQAHSGPVFALAVAPDGVPPGSSGTTTSSGSATAAGSGNTKNKNKRHGGVVVTLGDDSVTPDPSSGPAGPKGPAGSSGLGGAVGAGGGNGRSPCVLKFWGGADMGVCARAVDVAAQMRDGQQLRWATGGVAGAGEVPRLTAFAVTPDASQVRLIMRGEDGRESKCP